MSRDMETRLIALQKQQELANLIRMYDNGEVFSTPAEHQALRREIRSRAGLDTWIEGNIAKEKARSREYLLDYARVVLPMAGHQIGADVGDEWLLEHLRDIYQAHTRDSEHSPRRALGQISERFELYEQGYSVEDIEREMRQRYRLAGDDLIAERERALAYVRELTGAELRDLGWSIDDNRTFEHLENLVSQAHVALLGWCSDTEGDDTQPYAREYEEISGVVITSPEQVAEHHRRLAEVMGYLQMPNQGRTVTEIEGVRQQRAHLAAQNARRAARRARLLAQPVEGGEVDAGDDDKA